MYMEFVMPATNRYLSEGIQVFTELHYPEGHAKENAKIQMEPQYLNEQCCMGFGVLFSETFRCIEPVLTVKHVCASS
jgi:hypothetical protein